MVNYYKWEVGRVWLNTPHLKCGTPKGVGGSNPSLPSNFNVSVPEKSKGRFCKNLKP